MQAVKTSNNKKSVKLAILCTHPIQYYAPWFRFLAEGQKKGYGISDIGYGSASKSKIQHSVIFPYGKFEFEVLYAHKQTAKGQAEAGFGVEFEWDIPLLEGYPHRFLRNVSRRPGLDWFGGCDSPEIEQVLGKGSFTHLLCIGWHKKVFWQAIWAAKKMGIRTMSRGDSHLGIQGSTLRRVLKELTHRTMLKAFDAHLYVGKRNREYLRHYGVSESRLFFSPHFVDNEWWRANAERSVAGGGVREVEGAIRIEKLGSRIEGSPESSIPDPQSQKRATFLFAGKFMPKKRVMDLLEAAAQVPEAKVLLVGDGPQRAQLETRADWADLKGRVEFVGFKNQSELPYYLVQADCLVLASNSETWGLIVNEAMACGRPAIVSSACGCVPDLIEEGKTGYSYPMGDVDALANRMRQLMARRDQDWVNAVRTKTEKYSVEKATAGLFQAVENMD